MVASNYQEFGNQVVQVTVMYTKAQQWKPTRKVFFYRMKKAGNLKTPPSK